MSSLCSLWSESDTRNPLSAQSRLKREWPRWPLSQADAWAMYQTKYKQTRRRLHGNIIRHFFFKSFELSTWEQCSTRAGIVNFRRWRDVQEDLNLIPHPTANVLRCIRWRLMRRHHKCMRGAPPAYNSKHKAIGTNSIQSSWRNREVSLNQAKVQRQCSGGLRCMKKSGSGWCTLPESCPRWLQTLFLFLSLYIPTGTWSAF